MCQTSVSLIRGQWGSSAFRGRVTTIYRGGIPKKAKSIIADLRHFFFFRLLGCTCDGCRAWLEEGVSEKGSTWSHMRMSTARWVTREEWLWTIRHPLNKNDRNGSQCLKADQRPRERCTVTEAAKMLIEEEEIYPEYWMARPEEIIPSFLFTW